MAIFHWSAKNSGRSSGQSAVAAASYRSGEKLKCWEDGELREYKNRKERIVYSEIVLCENAPRYFADRETLWNEVEKRESASNARYFREIEVALPREFSRELQIKIMRAYVKMFTDEGMCADWSIHDDENGNPHAHIMLTTRPFKENGEWGIKQKKDYVLDDNGNRIPIIDKETGVQKVDERNRKQWLRANVPTVDWNKREKMEQWRAQWASLCNEYLPPDKHIDHRSFMRQGIDLIPQVHEGYVSRQMEKRGITSEFAQLNREIRSFNKDKISFVKDARALIKDIDRQITRLQILQNKHVSAITKMKVLQEFLDQMEREHQAFISQFEAQRRAIFAEKQRRASEINEQLYVEYCKNDDMDKESVYAKCKEATERGMVYITYLDNGKWSGKFDHKFDAAYGYLDKLREGYMFIMDNGYISGSRDRKMRQYIETPPEPPKVTPSPSEPERTAPQPIVTKKPPERVQEKPKTEEPRTYEYYMDNSWVLAGIKQYGKDTGKNRAKTLADDWNKEHGFEPLYFNRERDRNAPSGR